ncbi:MAG: S8 family serine peptidase, partial [Phycisphaerales bacterium]|nr:S8 family serine peptidase [Phycisphaerales bacterium]
MGRSVLVLSVCPIVWAPLLAAANPPLEAPAAVQHDPALMAAIDPGVRWVPDAVVVELAPDAARVVLATGLAELGVSGIASLDDIGVDLGVRELRPLFRGARPADADLRGLPDLSGWFTVEFDGTVGTLDQAIAAYATDPMVRDVQPIGVHLVTATPNDGSYPSQWHLNQASGIDMDAPAAWDTWTGSANTIVAVLDSGVRYYHKDLGGSGASSSNPGGTNGNVWLNLAEKNGTAGVDDDGNGYVDDWVGWDFVTGITSGCWSGEDCQTVDNDPRDFNGHGTHCAGNVAAISNNGYATASPAGGWGNGSLQAAGNGVKVMCLRMGYSGSYLGQEVGYVRMDFAASAFYYAANNGAKIASCSWGSSNSGGIAAAIDYFVAAGGLVFVAAGNSNNQTAGYVNSRNDCYSVAATDQADKKASFSSYGTWVDIASPGVAILSSYHVHADPANDYVATLDGTSMATPLTASVAASVWSQHPTWTRAEVWAQVRDTADPIDSLNPSYAGKLGSGRVNLAAALGSAPPPPPPPPPPPAWGAGTLLFALSNGTVVPGVGTVADEDIVAYTPSTGSWSLYFDGSDVGLASNGIAGLAVLPNGDLLISLSADGSVAGLTGGPSGTSVDNSDVIRFTPSSLGGTTAGSWTFYFDGSDVGLTTSGENIDGLAVTAGGGLLVSTSGNPAVPGLSSLADEDIILF